jgi:hypothetical protein
MLRRAVGRLTEWDLLRYSGYGELDLGQSLLDLTPHSHPYKVGVFT